MLHPLTFGFLGFCYNAIISSFEFRECGLFFFGGVITLPLVSNIYHNILPQYSTIIILCAIAILQQHAHTTVRTVKGVGTKKSFGDKKKLSFFFVPWAFFLSPIQVFSELFFCPQVQLFFVPKAFFLSPSTPPARLSPTIPVTP